MAGVIDSNISDVDTFYGSNRDVAAHLCISWTVMLSMILLVAMNHSQSSRNK